MCDDARMATNRADADACNTQPTANLADRRGEFSGQLANLLTAIGGQDRDAFADFFDLTGARVYGLAVRIVRDPTLAEDITQEVFIQVWTSADRYNPAAGSPLGWLMTLAHRRSVDRIRSEQTTANRDRDYGYRQLGRDHDIVTEQVEQNFDEQAVSRCLDSLTDVQREVIGLAYYSARTYREVADHLGVALPTVKSRIRDGLIRLKNCLGVNVDV